ncbi:MAG: YbjN domain-containing protein [Thermoguttaceae bacterium]|nr:YbjN domain-containing protein [Thermoguttaceae bacterium]
MTVDDLEELVKETGLYYRRSGNAIIVPLTLAEAPEKPIRVGFIIGDGYASATSVSEEFRVDDDAKPRALGFCNEWNYDNLTPRAYVDSDGRLRADMNVGIDGLSREYLIEDFVKRFVREAGDFFAEALVL